MFSQELLTNGELNHFSLKERMVEIGKRWHKLSAAQKDKYKKLVEEQQVEYKVELEAWLKVRPLQAGPQTPEAHLGPVSEGSFYKLVKTFSGTMATGDTPTLLRLPSSEKYS